MDIVSEMKGIPAMTNDELKPQAYQNNDKTIYKRPAKDWKDEGYMPSTKPSTPTSKSCWLLLRRINETRL